MLVTFRDIGLHLQEQIYQQVFIIGNGHGHMQEKRP